MAWLRNAATLFLLSVVATTFGFNACALHCEHADTDVVLLGDSNTWLGGDDCSGERGWSKWFADIYRPASIRSYARSGATWTNTPSTLCTLTENIEVLGNNNVIYNQVCRLKYEHASGRQPSPEIIIISAGTNDAWFAEHRPQAMTRKGDTYLSTTDFLNSSPSEVLTLQESVMMCCEMLREAFPEVKIVLLTPLQTVKVDNAKITMTGDLIEECARINGCRVIRQDKDSPVRSDAEKVKKVNTYDGTHTSKRGAQSNGELIARKVCEFFCNENLNSQ